MRFRILAFLFGTLAAALGDTNLAVLTEDALRAALTNGPLITFEASGSITLTRPLTITNVIIMDAGDQAVTLDGNNATRLFTVGARGDLTLSNLTLVAGRSTNGGAIYNNSGRVTASGCVFSNNFAIATAGAAGADGQDGSFDVGGAGGGGGNGRAGVGGAVYNLGTAFFVECRFLTNSAIGGAGGQGGQGGNGDVQGGDGGNGGDGGKGFGGAIYCRGTLGVTNCTFESNVAAGGAGGDGGSSGTGTIESFDGQGGNGGTATGGAIHSAGVAIIVGSTFANNQARGADSANGGTAREVIDGRMGGSSFGGGVANAGTHSLINCTFSSNHATGGQGGSGAASDFVSGDGGQGGDAWGGNFFNTGRALLTNCTFAAGAAFPGDPGQGGMGGFSGELGATGNSRGGNMANSNGAPLLLLRNTILANPASGSSVVTVTNVELDIDITFTTNVVAGVTNVTAQTNIFRTTNVVTVTNLIVGINAYGVIYDAGQNVSSDGTPALSGTSLNNTDPRLGPLQDNGGPTLTIGLRQGSPAIDRIAPAQAPSTDQRGVTRPIGAKSDVGAFEFEGSFISGRITDNDEGLAGVQVSAGNKSAITDENGEYTVFQLSPGTVTVTPTLEGYGFDPPAQTLTLETNLSDVDFEGFRIFSIAGRVTLAGVGFEGVTVTAGERSTLTDSNGVYTLTNVPAGEQAVVPSLAGYAFEPPSLPVTLEGDLDGIDFAAIRLVTLGGRITNGYGAVANVTLTLDGSTTTRTDTNGQYSFSGLLPGAHTVGPVLSGYFFTPPLQSVTLGPDDNTGVDFTATGIYDLSGRITNSVSGAGVADAMVTLGNVTNQTDANGNYSFSNLGPGSYSITPRLPGYALNPAARGVSVPPARSDLDFGAALLIRVSGRVVATNTGTGLSTVVINAAGQTGLTDTNGDYAITNVPAGMVPITPALVGYGFAPPSRTNLLAADTAGVNFGAFRVFSVAGRITVDGRGLSGVTVSAGTFSNRTDSGGNYTISAVPEGNHTVTPNLAGFQFTPVSQPVALSSNVSGINFTAAGTNIIQGYVTNSAGAGVSNVTLTASNMVATSAGSGFYSFPGLVPGSYTVTPRLPQHIFDPEYIEVGVTSAVVTASFRAVPVFNVSGRVTETNNGLAGVLVRAFGLTNVQTVTDSGGYYTLASVAGGTNTVRAESTGFEFEPTNAVIFLESSTTIDFSAFRVYSVQGRVTSGGLGVSNVLVAVGNRSGLSDSNGNYFVSARAGSYSAVPALAGYAFTPASAPVTLPPNTNNVNFTAAGTLGLSGRVTDETNGTLTVSGVRVTADTNVTFTDVRGNYSFTNLTPRTYTVVAQTNGVGYSPASTNVTLAGVSVAGVDFTANGARLSLMPTNEQMRLLGLGLPLRSYRIQAVTNLTSPINWQTLATRSSDTNGVFEYLDTAATNAPIQFYRTIRP